MSEPMRGEPCMNPVPEDDRMLVLLERLEAARVLIERGLEKIVRALGDVK